MNEIEWQLEGQRAVRQTATGLHIKDDLSFGSGAARAKRSRPDPYSVAGVLAVAATRILFRSRLLYDLDSVNFALALERFDPAAHQPHPPGYFLYVQFARLIQHALPDANTALVAVSILASCGAAWMIYQLAAQWFGRGAGRMAMLLFVVSPLCWFHGIVALVYIVEAFFSALVGYWCWRAWSGAAIWAVPASIALAVAAGFRPSTALLLAPLWVLMLSRLDGRRRWTAILSAGATGLAWFLPMTAQAGGWGTYFAALTHLWSGVAAQRTALQSSWLVVGRVLTIGWIFVLCFGSGAALLWRGGPYVSPRRDERVRFTCFWVAPGLLFFSFVFLNFVNSGYLLVLSPPVFAFLGARLHRFLKAAGGRGLRRAAAAGGIAVNCGWFAFAPLYCSYRSVQVLERELTAVARDFRAGLDPAKTLIVGFDSHFLGYRHAGYYLPDFVTAQYPEVGRRVFAMHHRDTAVLWRLAVAPFDQFVLFPLPGGPHYAEYLDTVQRKFPSGVLRTVVIGGREVWAAPISELPILFPNTAALN